MASWPASASDLLRDLIAIPSINPDGIPEQSGTGEQACAEYVRDFLERCGAEVWLDEVLPGRPNVIGRFPSEGSGKSCVLFGPHLDTVSIEGMSIDPYGAELRDGRIWGRGASDTKGSVAAMLWALWELRERVPNLGAEVIFAGFMGEESAQHGSRHFVEHHGRQVSFGIVGEPTELDVVHAHKACWWVQLAAKGKAAHGSRPELGENAVVRMAEAVLVLEREFGERLERFDDDVLGRSTLSVNLFHGGSRANIVPDHCTAQLDLRITPALHERGVVAELEAFLADKGFGDLTTRVLAQSPTLKTDPAHPLIGKLTALGSKVATAPWFCDAGWLAGGGIPAVALGPGSIAQAHTKDEWITVEDLESGARFFQRFLESL